MYGRNEKGLQISAGKLEGKVQVGRSMNTSEKRVTSSGLESATFRLAA
jgi:hypothetical protein